MIFDQWNVWKRALIVNALGAVGIASSEARLSPSYCVPIAVVALTLLNLVFLAVRPQSLAAKADGKPKVGAFQLLIELVQERPLMALLVGLQLIAVSRSATAAVTFFQASGGRFRTLADPSNLSFWLMVYSVVMALVAGIWLASAVGIWCRRSWAWWLALVLNGLAASITSVLQLLDRHSYLLDIGAFTAVVLLLLPSVRGGTGCSGTQQQPA